MSSICFLFVYKTEPSKISLQNCLIINKRSQVCHVEVKYIHAYFEELTISCFNLPFVYALSIERQLEYNQYFNYVLIWLLLNWI